MPNWVYNNLSVTGPAKEVQRLKDHVAQPYTAYHYDYQKDETVPTTVEGEFLLWNCVSPPEEKRDLYFARANGSEDKTWGWYNWNIRNWGTKWDTSNRCELEEHDKDHLQYRMETAWSPPLEAIAALSKLFPSVYLELSYEEEQGWGGTYLFHEGVGSEEETYDIPTSHAEHMDRKHYCGCEDTGEKWFSDCPVATVSAV